jgi:hypothetical protein
MNAWLTIRRLRGPAFLILVGVTALLNQWGVLSFGHSWPLYLILAGVLGLAERAALMSGSATQYPGVVNPYAPQGYPYSPVAPPTASQAEDPRGRSL